jgi:hypothetical protein
MGRLETPHPVIPWFAGVKGAEEAYRRHPRGDAKGVLHGDGGQGAPWA